MYCVRLTHKNVCCVGHALLYQFVYRTICDDLFCLFELCSFRKYTILSRPFPIARDYGSPTVKIFRVIYFVYTFSKYTAISNSNLSIISKFPIRATIMFNVNTSVNDHKISTFPLISFLFNFTLSQKWP